MALHQSTPTISRLLFTLKRKGSRSRHRVPTQYRLCVTAVWRILPPSLPRWRKCASPLISSFFRVLKSCRSYFSLPSSLFPDELVFAPVHRREYSLISDIHSSPLTDGVITSSAGISAIGHDQSVRFSPRKEKKKKEKRKEK